MDCTREFICIICQQLTCQITTQWQRKSQDILPIQHGSCNTCRLQSTNWRIYRHAKRMAYFASTEWHYEKRAATKSTGIFKHSSSKGKRGLMWLCRLYWMYWDFTKTQRISRWIQSGRSLTMFIPEITRLGQALRHYRSEQGHNWSLFLVRKIPSLLYLLARLQRLQYVVLLFFCHRFG